jgi:hypothetical protein
MNESVVLTIINFLLRHWVLTIVVFGIVGGILSIILDIMFGPYSRHSYKTREYVGPHIGPYERRRIERSSKKPNI